VTAVELDPVTEEIVQELDQGIYYARSAFCVVYSLIVVGEMRVRELPHYDRQLIPIVMNLDVAHVGVNGREHGDRLRAFRHPKAGRTESRGELRQEVRRDGRHHED
jgi:hypothetical protein